MLSRAGSGASRLAPALAVTLAFAACSRRDAGERADPESARDDSKSDSAGEPNPTAEAAEPPGEVIDVHVHLIRDTAGALLETFDAAGVDRAVVLATPHLDPSITAPGMRGYRDANAVVLGAARAHPTRLIPFLALDLGETAPEYVAAQLDAGACGVKIYQGHRALRERPLDDPRHDPVFALLERRGVPVLIHVNTVRYKGELAGLLGKFPALRAVCAHLCGSRTDLDRLTGLMAEFPKLLFDTSNGAGPHGAAGFTHLEGERERFRNIVAEAPERFLFGSDLVTERRGRDLRGEWRDHITANIRFLTDDTFRFWRRARVGTALTIQEYRGMALDEPIRARVLSANARRWLGDCILAE